MNLPLYLASQSPSRQMLLKQAEIPFTVLEQSADERTCDWSKPLEELVKDIALIKMESLKISFEISDGQILVLTADTLTRDKEGRILGKPHTRENATKMLRSLKAGGEVCTAFCLDKKIFESGKWITQIRIIKAVKASLVFDIPEQHYDEYFTKTSALQCSGSLAIEGYGSRFLKKVKGSYSTIIGLPLYELQRALERCSNKPKIVKIIQAKGS